MLNITEENLPEEWKDEDRINSLFSPLRSRSVNPKDWDYKLSSWKTILWLYCENNNAFSFTLPHLRKTFVRHGRPPSCLNSVLQELLNNGELQYLDDFIKKSPETWSGWAADLLVKKPISWSWNKIRKSILTQTPTENQVLVHVGVIRSESQKLFTLLSGKYKNKVIVFSDVIKLINNDKIQSNDLKLLLHQLSEEGKVCVANFKNTNEDSDTLLIKVGGDKTISEYDLSVYTLERNEQQLKEQIEQMEDEIENSIKETKAHLLKKHRQLAKTCLKQKHEIEKRLMKKINVLQNVQVLLEKVKDVRTDAQVLQSYKGALAAFNKTLNETSLTEDTVEDTILKLSEMMDVHEDIQTSLSKSLVEEDDAELELELAELMKSNPSHPKHDKKESVIDNLDEQLSHLDITNLLPVTPSHNISDKEVSLNNSTFN